MTCSIRNALACSLLLVIASAAAAAQGRAAESPARPPNIVLILADDLGWADLACYGNTFNETPNIDRLAAQGVRFTQFYASGPVCSPTRAGLQTGRHQARYGLTVHIPGHWRPFERLVEPPNALQLPVSAATIAERLGDAGYATGYFGKWHLGGDGYGPREQGWQTAIEIQGHDVRPRVSGGRGPQRLTEFLADRAIEFIGENKERPFLLMVSHYAVHIPINTTPELLEKYEAKPPMPGYPSRPDYAGLLEEMDRSVGRVVESLDRHGLSENTLVIFTSDNGGLAHQQNGTVVTSNAPLRGEKGMLYEGGIRVPCIARWPGVIPNGADCDQPATTLDLCPTFLELAGRPTDDPLDGTSLVPTLREPRRRDKTRSLYWHFPHYHHSRPSGAIRRGDWKLIEFFDTGELELFNLADDLSGTRNLVDDQPEIARELHESLIAWRRDVQAQMPQENPAYDPERAEEWWSRRKVAPSGPPGGGRGRNAARP